MRFLSIYKTKETGVPPSPEHIAEMGKLIEESMKSGVLIATEGCLPSARGARVRRAGANVTVTDGPFTESKEVVGGFWLLEATTYDEVLAFLKDHPHLEAGSLEVRQIWDM